MLKKYIYANAIPNILKITDIDSRDEILGGYLYHEKCGLMPQIISDNIKLLIPVVFPEKTEAFRVLKKIMIPVLSTIILDYLDEKITRERILKRISLKRDKLSYLIDDHVFCCKN